MAEGEVFHVTENNSHLRKYAGILQSLKHSSSTAIESRYSRLVSTCAHATCQGYKGGTVPKPNGCHRSICPVLIGQPSLSRDESD